MDFIKGFIADPAGYLRVFESHMILHVSKPRLLDVELGRQHLYQSIHVIIASIALTYYQRQAR